MQWQATTGRENLGGFFVRRRCERERDGESQRRGGAGNNKVDADATAVQGSLPLLLLRSSCVCFDVPSPPSFYVLFFVFYVAIVSCWIRFPFFLLLGAAIGIFCGF